MRDIPDPPIVPSWHPLARDLLPEKRCQCDKCGDWFPKSETAPMFAAAPWVRVCFPCKGDSDG